MKQAQYMVFSVLLIFQIQTVSLNAQTTADSVRIRLKTFPLLWYPNYFLFQPTLNSKMNQKVKKKKPFSPGIKLFRHLNVPRKNWKLDYRESSYYVPRQVNDRLAKIMDRPLPSSFMPLMALVYLAARLVTKTLRIQKKIEITAGDYLIDSQYDSLLLALWKKSPRTAEELYRLPQFSARYTLRELQQKLNWLSEQKLVKRRTREQLPTLYFAAQSAAIAKLTIERGLIDTPLDMKSRTRLNEWLKLINENF